MFHTIFQNTSYLSVFEFVDEISKNAISNAMESATISRDAILNEIHE